MMGNEEKRFNVLKADRIYKILIVLWILIIGIPITSTYVVFTFVNHIIQKNTFSFSSVICFYFMLLMNLLSLKLFDNIVKQINKNIQCDKEQNYLLIKQEQYINIINSYEDITSLRHDMKNHLILISAYLNNGKNQEALQYVEKLSGNLLHTTEVIISGNVTIDAVLNNKKQIMMEKGIALDIDIVLFDQVLIEDIDLCTLLGNALDNAIEACERIEHQDRNKYIKVKIRCKNDNFLLHMVNTYNPNSIKKIHEVFISTKKNRKFAKHRIGLGNMKKTINKYSGKLKIETTDTLFTLNALLSNGYENVFHI